MTQDNEGKKAKKNAVDPLSSSTNEDPSSTLSTALTNKNTQAVSKKSKTASTQDKPKSKKSKSKASSVKSKDSTASKRKSSDRSSKKSKSTNSKAESKKSKSADGRKSKSTSADSRSKDGEKKRKRDKSKQTKKKSHKKSSNRETRGTSSATSLSKKERNTIERNILKVQESKGAVVVAKDSMVTAANYEVNLSNKLYQSDYSQVFGAKNKTIKTFGGLVVKMINLTECSPRHRANLLENAVRIIRYVGGGGGVKEVSSPPLSDLFIKVYDVYLVSGVKLLIFMDEFNSSRLLYDLVKSSESILHINVRAWTKAIALGVNELQQIGVAHRSIKLQHIMFNYSGKPKLCGWSKAVYYYEPHKGRILLQHKERRVRRNYHLPPEAFLSSYDPSKADIWSIGIVLVAMSTKRYPFTVRDATTKFASQWRAFIKKNELNTYMRNLCHKIFIIDPNSRISSSQILEDKYFSVENDKLALVSCKTDPNEVREDTRVGAVSAIELDTPPSPSSKKETTTTTKPAAAVADEQTDASMQPTDPTEEDLTELQDGGGGTVGDEENLPPEEQAFESQMAEATAPEEGEDAAQPEEATPGDEANGETAEEENTGEEVNENEEIEK